MRWNNIEFPSVIETGTWTAGHIQGIAIDPVKGFAYYSYTTILVKARLDGSIVGWVGGLVGHLGCIDFNDEDGKVYGSLEYKHDIIGRSIAHSLGTTLPEEDAFYICVFDVDRIDRPDMDAEKDGVVRSVYLPQIAAWHHKKTMDGRENDFYVSGIDGLGIGPVFGKKDGESRLMLSSGAFSDPDHPYKNDYNVILQYDWRELDRVAVPLTQKELHHCSLEPETYYFLDIGESRWGIQNFEYDKNESIWWVSVYLGADDVASNFPLYAVDGFAKPERKNTPYGGSDEHLVLKQEGLNYGKRDIYGFEFPLGQTGIYAFGNGYFYFSEPRDTKDGKQTGTIYLYKRTPGDKCPFKRVEG